MKIFFNNELLNILYSYFKIYNFLFLGIAKKNIFYFNNININLFIIIYIFLFLLIIFLLNIFLLTHISI